MSHGGDNGVRRRKAEARRAGSQSKKKKGKSRNQLRKEQYRKLAGVS